jgi:hypothetical protein
MPSGSDGGADVRLTKALLVNSGKNDGDFMAKDALAMLRSDGGQP